jgi:hypothetical protein
MGSLFFEEFHRLEGHWLSDIPGPLLHPVYYLILCAFVSVSLDLQITTTLIFDVSVFAFLDFKLEIFQVVI